MALNDSARQAPAGLAFRDRWEVVYEELRERILSGEMPPGSQIREVELAESFGVSRGPIREAIRELQVVGLVIRGPRQPSYVAPVSIVDIDEVFTLREVIEALAVERSVKRGGQAMLDLLRERSNAVEDAIDRSLSTMEIVEADIAFVSTFYDFSDNRRLSAVWASIIDPLRSMLRLGMHREDPEWKTRWTGHAEITDAAAAGNVKLASRLVRGRIEGGREDLIRFVSEQSDQS